MLSMSRFAESEWWLRIALRGPPVNGCQTNFEAIRHRNWDADQRVSHCVEQGAKGADWTDYNRSLRQSYDGLRILTEAAAILCYAASWNTGAIALGAIGGVFEFIFWSRILRRPKSSSGTTPAVGVSFAGRRESWARTFPIVASAVRHESMRACDSSSLVVQEQRLHTKRPSTESGLRICAQPSRRDSGQSENTRQLDTLDRVDLMRNQSGERCISCVDSDVFRKPRC